MKGKNILLTGGTGGLGIAVTKKILDAEAKSILFTYRSPRSVVELKAELSYEEISRINFVSANLNDESSVISLIDQMERVDCFIHLVGGFAMGRTDEFSFTDWQKMLDLNLNNAFLLGKHCLRRMRETGYGRMVFVGSRGGVQPGAQLAAYSAAKAGLIGLVGAIAQETLEKDTDITANCVLPSVIDTPKNREAMGTQEVWRWVTPESLAGVIVFLASDAAKDIRGAAIPVYGKA